MKDDIIIGIMTIIISGALLVIVTVGDMAFAYFSDVQACNQKFAEFEHKQDGFWARCQIKVNGKWIPSTAYREMD